MECRYSFAGPFVSNRDQATAWYERLVGRAPNFLPNDVEAVWQVTSTSSFYVLAGPDRSGRDIVALVVDDLNAVVKGIAERGIVDWEPEEVPGAGRKANYTDPDGNQVSFLHLFGQG